MKNQREENQKQQQGMSGTVGKDVSGKEFKKSQSGPPGKKDVQEKTATDESCSPCGTMTKQ